MRACERCLAEHPLCWPSSVPQPPQDNKALKKTKKALKHRFWTEIYQGAAGVAGQGAVAELRTTHTNSSSSAALTVGAHLCWAPTPPHPTQCPRRRQALLPQRHEERQVPEAGGAQPG